MKNKIVLLGLVPFLMSCAGSPIKASRADFMTGHAPTGVVPSAITSDLTRSAKMSTSGYAVSVTLLTQPLIEAKNLELGRRTASSETETHKEIEKEVRAFVKKGTCFEFTYYTLSINGGFFRTTSAKAADASSKWHPITFMDLQGASSVPTQNGTSFDVGDGYTWRNFTIGCTAKPLNIASGVVVHFVPLSEGREPARLEWQVGL